MIVDTYGGTAPHCGVAFSGKYPTKVDRSSAYAARYLAKNVVAAGLAKRCQIQLAYAIGIPEPVSVMLDTGGTAAVDEERIAAVLTELVDLRPRGIIRHLGLDRPIYFKTAAYRSEEHTSELQSIMRISYAVFCLKKKRTNRHM